MTNTKTPWNNPEVNALSEEQKRNVEFLRDLNTLSVIRASNSDAIDHMKNPDATLSAESKRNRKISRATQEFMRVATENIDGCSAYIDATLLGFDETEGQLNTKIFEKFLDQKLGDEANRMNHARSIEMIAGIAAFRLLGATEMLRTSHIEEDPKAAEELISDVLQLFVTLILGWFDAFTTAKDTTDILHKIKPLLSQEGMNETIFQEFLETNCKHTATDFLRSIRGSVFTNLARSYEKHQRIIKDIVNATGDDDSGPAADEPAPRST